MLRALFNNMIGEKCKWSTMKRKDGSITHVSRILLVVFCSVVIIFGVDGIQLANSPINQKAFAQEESFFEICDNFVDDDGDGFADADDPEGCSPIEGGESAPSQGTPAQELITYPDGTTCDPNTQSCPPPAEDITCDPNTQSCPPPAEDITCDPNTQSCPPPAEDITCDPNTQSCPPPARSEEH